MRSRWGRLRGGTSNSTEVSDESVVRDAEESLVAALQESDTAVEALHDSAADSGTEPAADRRRWALGAGLALAILGVFVARRRR